MFFFFRRRQGNSFNPASYGTRLKAWWKPTADKVNSGSVADGDPISTLADSSANARDLTQAGGKRPVWDDTLTASGYGIFDGVDDLLVYTAASPVSTASSGGIFFVIRPSSVTGTQTIFSTGDESVATAFLAVQLSGTSLQVAQNAGGTEDRVNTSSLILAVNTAYVVSIVSTGTAWQVRVNQIDQSLSAASGSNSGDWFGDVSGRDNAAIGMRKTSAESSPFNGYIGEGFVVDDALTDSEIASAEAYLMARYGAAFSPAQVSGLRMWLDALDSSTVTIGTGVSQWTDKSGNGFDATQATGSAQPAYSATGGINSKPALVFDGIDDQLTTASNPITDSSDFTIFYVGNGNFVRGIDGAGGWSVRGNGTVAANKAVVFTTTSTSQYVANVPASGNPCFLCFTVDQNSPTNSTLVSYYENVASTPSVVANYALRTSTVNIGFGVNSAGSFTNGATSSFLIYNRVLTTAEREGVMNWLLARYS